jgi:hypothetical protein
MPSRFYSVLPNFTLIFLEGTIANIEDSNILANNILLSTARIADDVLKTKRTTAEGISSGAFYQRLM